MIYDWTGVDNRGVGCFLDGVEVPALRADPDAGWVDVDAAFEEWERTGVDPGHRNVERRTGKVEIRKPLVDPSLLLTPGTANPITVSHAGRMTLNE